MLWLLLGVLLVCSGTVSACETSLFGLSRRALQEFQSSGNPMRRRVHALMQEPHQVLMTVLIANTAINVAIFSAAFFTLRGIAESSALAAAAAALAVPIAVILFGEMLPKALALSNPRHFAPPAAGLIATLQLVLVPIQRVLDRFVIAPITRLLAPSNTLSAAVTADELRMMVEHSAREGVINTAENEMLQAIVALGTVSVREVMTPRVDMRAVAWDAPRDDLLASFRETGRRRLPVRGRDLDDIRGLLYRRDLHLQRNTAPKALLRRIRFVPEQANLMQVLRHFREEHITLAIVVDEHGGTAGLVSVHDIVQWIVGVLPDAEGPRRAAPSQRIDDCTYRISGDLSVRDWAGRFDVGDVDRHVDTVAGLILARLGRLPQHGDTIRIRNLTLKVESMRDRRIEHVLLTLDTPAQATTRVVEGTRGAKG